MGETWVGWNVILLKIGWFFLGEIWLGETWWGDFFGWNVIGWNVIGRTVTTPDSIICAVVQQWNMTKQESGWIGELWISQPCNAAWKYQASFSSGTIVEIHNRRRNKSRNHNTRWARNYGVFYVGGRITTEDSQIHRQFIYLIFYNLWFKQ